MEKEELEKLFNMVHEGIMTPNEAVRLMEAAEEKGPGGVSAEEAAAVGDVSSLKIRVTDLSTGKTKVNMSIPLWLVKGALKLGGKKMTFSWLGTNGVGGKDMTEQLREMLDAGKRGALLDVLDEEENERVQIFLE